MQVEGQEEETTLWNRPLMEARAGNGRSMRRKNGWIRRRSTRYWIVPITRIKRKRQYQKWGRPKTRPAYADPVVRSAAKKVQEKEYLLVDGYNVILVRDELNELVKVNLDERGKAFRYPL